MDSLFLLQFACFIFMLINAFFVALSHLHVRWKNMRYERLASFTDSPLLSISFHIVLLLSNWIFYSRSKGKEIKNMDKAVSRIRLRIIDEFCKHFDAENTGNLLTFTP